MNISWERDIEAYKVNISDIKLMFASFLKGDEVIDYSFVKIGARNSNYIVTTLKTKYFLRLCVINSEGYKNEFISYSLLKDKINMPKPLFMGTYKGYRYIIYEFIKGISLEYVNIDDKIVREVAKNAAIIHSVPKKDYMKYDLLKYPPFNKWIDIFLNNPLLKQRIGNELIERIRKLSVDKFKELIIIDLYKSFTHCDFRCSNMLINEKGKIYIVDWEFGNEGHILGDIGQFFRFKEDSLYDKRLIFQEEYNANANIKLPDNWYDLSKLRDLINPIQMLGNKNIGVNKNRALKELIVSTLNYFHK